MPGPKAAELKLEDEEKKELEKLVRGYKTKQQIAKRAQIILKAAEGIDSGTISQTVKVARKTVHNWRQRWRTLEAIPLKELSVEERLEDLPRPGVPPTFTADQRCQLEALACEAPEKSGRPISQWTAREIAEEAMKQNIVESISPRHAARLLKRSINSTP